MNKPPVEKFLKRLLLIVVAAFASFGVFATIVGGINDAAQRITREGAIIGIIVVFFAGILTDAFLRIKKPKWWVAPDGQKYPIVKLGVKPWSVLLGAIIFLSLAYVFYKPPSPPIFMRLPNGALIGLASEEEMQQEINESSSEMGQIAQAAREQQQQAIDYFETGRHDFEAGRYNDAARNFQLSLDTLQTTPASFNLGVALYYTRDLSRAREVLTTGYNQAVKQGDPRFQAKFLNALGNVYRSQGEPNLALDAYTQAINISREYNSPEYDMSDVLVTALTNQGLVLLEQGDLDKAEGVFSEAEQISSVKPALVEYRGAILNYQGILLTRQHKFTEAEETFNRAYALGEQANNEQMQIATLVNRGNTAKEIGRLPEAIDAYSQTLQLALEETWPIERADALNNICVVRLEQGMLKEALEMCQDAQRIADAVPIPLAQPAVRSTLGAVIAAQGDLVKAREVLEDAKQYAKKVNDPYTPVDATINIARTYLQDEDRASAIKELELAFDDAKKVHYLYGQMISSYLLGEAFAREGNLDQAQYWLIEAADIAAQANNDGYHLDALNLLGNIYAVKGGFLKAMELFKEAEEIGVISNNQLGKALALYNQGSLLTYQKKYEEARPLLETARPILNEYHYDEQVADIDNMLKEINKQ